MFKRAEEFQSDLSLWDTSSAENMEAMFLFAKSFNADLSSWVTSRVTSMEFMFGACEAFNSDISQWDTARVTNFAYVLAECPQFNQPLQSWSLRNAGSLEAMFVSSSSFNQNLCSWGISLSPSVDVSNMFLGTSCQDTDDPDLSADPPGPFCFECVMMATPSDAPTQFPASDKRCFETTDELMGAVDDYLEDPSGGLTAETYGHPIGTWCVRNIMEFDGLFNATRNPRASTFNEPLQGWDVSNAVSMFAMFYEASAFNQDLSGWDVSSVRNFIGMFANATSFNGDVSSWGKRRLIVSKELRCDIDSHVPLSQTFLLLISMLKLTDCARRDFIGNFHCVHVFKCGDF